MLDAMPMPVFLVDQDVGILEYNSAAAQLLQRDKGLVLRRRGGEVLHCVHSTDVTEGCGRGPACCDCVVRQSVQAAAKGRRVTRQAASMELLKKGKQTKVNLRVTSQPFTYEQHSFVLLILEGLND